MQERHDILARTIGYLDEEKEALDTGYLLLFGSFTMIFIGTLLEILFFWMYNGSYHPFANILTNYSDEDECKIINNQTELIVKFQSMISMYLGSKVKRNKIVVGAILISFFLCLTLLFVAIYFATPSGEQFDIKKGPVKYTVYYVYKMLVYSCR